MKWGGDDDVWWPLMTHLKLYQVLSMTSQKPKRTNLLDLSKNLQVSVYLKKIKENLQFWNICTVRGIVNKLTCKYNFFQITLYQLKYNTLSSGWTKRVKTEYWSFGIIYRTKLNNTEPNLISGKNKGSPLVGQLFPFLLYFYVTNFSKKKI